MKCTIPEISWHNREPVLSVDINPISNDFYRLATGGGDCHVLIWQLEHSENGAVKVECISDLTRHQRAVNSVRWSPNGQYLASADDDANIIIWHLKTDNIPSLEDENNEKDKEIWLAYKVLRGHKEDIYDLCWSIDGTKLFSGSVDNTAIIWDLTKGKSDQILTDHKGFVQGVAWDPKNQLIATISTDRFCRLFDTSGKQVVSRIIKGKLPVNEDHYLYDKEVKYFHDDTFKSFFRRLQFSPEGSLLTVPSGHMEADDCKKPLNGTLIFTLDNFSSPAAILPLKKQCSTVVKFCPIVFELHENGPEPILDLPYRMILAVGTDHDVILYDTQQKAPFARFQDIHYTRLTDLTWSQDGLLLMAASTDGFCALITFDSGELGVPYSKEIVDLDETMEVVEEEKEKESVVNEKVKEEKPRKPSFLQQWAKKTPQKNEERTVKSESKEVINVLQPKRKPAEKQPEKINVLQPKKKVDNKEKVNILVPKRKETNGIETIDLEKVENEKELDKEAKSNKGNEGTVLKEVEQDQKVVENRKTPKRITPIKLDKVKTKKIDLNKDIIVEEDVLNMSGFAEIGSDEEDAKKSEDIKEKWVVNTPNLKKKEEGKVEQDEMKKGKRLVVLLEDSASRSPRRITPKKVGEVSEDLKRKLREEITLEDQDQECIKSEAVEDNCKNEETGKVQEIECSSKKEDIQKKTKRSARRSSNIKETTAKKENEVDISKKDHIIVIEDEEKKDITSSKPETLKNGTPKHKREEREKTSNTPKSETKKKCTFFEKWAKSTSSPKPDEKFRKTEPEVIQIEDVEENKEIETKPKRKRKKSDEGSGKKKRPSFPKIALRGKDDDDADVIEISSNEDKTVQEEKTDLKKVSPAKTPNSSNTLVSMFKKIEANKSSEEKKKEEKQKQVTPKKGKVKEVVYLDLTEDVALDGMDQDQIDKVKEEDYDDDRTEDFSLRLEESLSEPENDKNTQNCNGGNKEKTEEVEVREKVGRKRVPLITLSSPSSKKRAKLG